jgi:alpha-L-fucosidase 2
MSYPTRRQFFGSVPMAAVLNTVANGTNARAQAASAESNSAVGDAIAVVSKHKAVFTRPPEHIPYQYAVDAPLLGNGDMLAALAGAPEYPQFWVTLNDFWELKNECWLMGLTENVLTPSGNGQGGPRPVGRLILQIPTLTGASYRVEQDLATATTNAHYEKSGIALELRSWVSATENLLVIELTARGQSLDASVVFHFPDEPGAGVTDSAKLGGLDVHPLQEKGLENGVLWATREYKDGVDMPTKAALAAHFLDPAGVTGQPYVGTTPFGGRGAVSERGPRIIVRLEPGRTQTMAVAMRSWFKHLSPLEAARGRSQWIRPDDVRALRELHEAWWRRYWNVSSVELDDPVVEQRYYLSQYVMGSLSRDPDFPPNIFGFESWDRPVWCGDHKIDYNYEMSFAAMYTSGRLDQAAPYEAPLLAAMDNAQEMARRLPIGRRGGIETVPSRDPVVGNGHRGVHFAIGLGPKGHLPENGSWGAKNQNAFALLPIAWRWNLTRDLDYAWKVYPLVREVANFWEDDLVLDDGRYVMKGDCTAECGGNDAALNSTNPTNGLGFVRAAMRLALDLSEALGVDRSRQEKWRHILDHMSRFPTRPAEQIQIGGKTLAELFPAGARNGRAVFIAQEGVNTLDRFMEHVYPSGELGLDAGPGLLKIANDTVEALILSSTVGGTTPTRSDRPRNPWHDFNLDCIFFPVTVRIGYDPEVIWRELHSSIVEIGGPNGFRSDNPHGMEKVNTVPNTVNEMLLLSHENVLRFFRVWPRKSHPNARFRDLRAYGAFRVSAALTKGEVAGIRIVSEKGRDCAVENPWPAKRVTVFRDGRKAEVVQGEKFILKTRTGELIELKA